MATNLTDWYQHIEIYLPGCPLPMIDKALIEVLRDFCGYAGVWKSWLSPISSVVIEQADDIAFVSGTPCTITSTSTDFSTSGLTDGDIIVTDHATANSNEKDNTGPFEIDTVAANTLTLDSKERLVSETAGDDTTISKCEYALSTTLGDICKVLEAKYDGYDMLPKTEDWFNANLPDWRWQMAGQPEYYLVDMAGKKIRLVYAPNDAIENAIEVWVVLKPLLAATTVEDFIYDEYYLTIAAGVIAKLAMIPKQEWSDPGLAQVNQAMFAQGRVKAWYDGNTGISKGEFDYRA